MRPRMLPLGVWLPVPNRLSSLQLAAAITAPALIVPGTDPTHPREVAEHLHRRLPRATLRDAAPDDYAPAITAFLADIAASAQLA